MPNEEGRGFPFAGEEVFFQSHRGGCAEAPENSLPSMLYSWQFPGAIPEIDARTLKDGSVICLHDASLARTTDADRALARIPVSRLRYEEVLEADAGIKWGESFRGCRVPLLADVLALLREVPGRRLYVEMKDGNFPVVASMIRDFGVEDRVIFIQEDEGYCRRMLEAFPRSKTMTWCGGPPRAIRRRFALLAMKSFYGLKQVQLHLPITGERGRERLGLALDFISRAFETTRAAGVDLQLCPKLISSEVLARLLELGVRWFVTERALALRRGASGCR